MRQTNQYAAQKQQIDEATDTANKPLIIVFIRYINSSGQLRTNFLGLQELSHTDASSVFEATKDILAHHKLPLDRMFGLASDGASVMTGVHKGVATQFKNLVKHLVTTHCMAHRLQLASEKAAHSVPYIVKYIAVLNQFAKALKFSPKFTRCLEESKLLNDVRARKIKQIFFTHWLSFSDSVQALAGCIGPVISALQSTAMERDTSGRAVLHGVLDQIATVKFVFMTHFLADVVGVLGLLSRSLQNEDITYTSANAQLDAAVIAIESMKTSHGPFTAKVLEAISGTPDESGYVMFEQHDIKDKASYRTKFREATIDSSTIINT